jgi:protein-disulfide isomerase
MSIAPRTQRIIDAATLLIAGCAFLLTGLVAYRQFSSPRPAPMVTEVADWQYYATAGQTIGSTDGGVTAVVFADFECIACRRISSYVDSLGLLGSRLKVIYRHYPAAGNWFASRAAHVSACAAKQVGFEAIYHALYGNQYRIGVDSWWFFARAAGATDSVGFTQCLSQSSERAALDRDTADARRLGVRTVPTILIHRWRFDGLPPFDSIKKYVATEAIQQD